MATFTSATSGNWNVAATWGTGGLSGSGSPVAGTHYPHNSDEAHIDSGHTVTLVADVSVGNVVIDGGTLAGGGYKITCVKTSGRLFDHSGTISGVLDLELQGTHSTNEDLMGTGNVRNLTINGSGLNVTTGRETTLDGTLTITQGTVTTGNYGLTTGSDLSIAANGTLNGSGTANHSFASLTIASGGVYSATSGTTTITSEKDHSGQGYGWRNDGGTFTHNKGLVKFDTPANTIIKENTWYNFELYADGSSRQYEIRDVSGNEITFLGNLTLTAGRLKTTTSTDTVTIHGNTSITSSAKCWHNAHQDTNKITHHGLVTNKGEFKINDGTTVKLNGGIRNMGTITVA